MNFKEGVYFHPKKGMAIVEKSEDKSYDWKIDKNKKKRHPLFRFDIPVHEAGTGEYFFIKSLKDYEYIGEL